MGSRANSLNIASNPAAREFSCQNSKFLNIICAPEMGPPHQKWGEYAEDFG